MYMFPPVGVSSNVSSRMMVVLPILRNERRTLTGTVVSNYTDNLAWLNCEVDVFDHRRRLFMIPKCEVFDLDFHSVEMRFIQYRIVRYRHFTRNIHTFEYIADFEHVFDETIRHDPSEVTYGAEDTLHRRLQEAKLRQWH